MLRKPTKSGFLPGNIKVVTLGLALAVPTLCIADESGTDSFKFDGSLREELSWNTRQWADVPNYNTAGKLSMARTTLRLNGEWDATPDLAVVGKVMAAKEIKTGFLNHLQQMGANNYQSGAQGNLMALYNDAEIRELYLDYKFNNQFKLRFGRQQIAWGETDFFAANDMVSGFDYTWRSFLEPSNELVRKTNIMAKLNIDLPEANGGIEMFVRPGWDRKQDIGNTIDIYGGRWSGQPYAGVDFRNIDPYNFSNSVGNYEKPTGGIRWIGTEKDFNYSASIMKTFWQSPMLNANSTLALLGHPNVPSGATTVGASTTLGPAGEIIYPLVDVLGFTGSGYANWADSVFSAELAFIKDAPYQIMLATPTPISQAVAPGFDGLMNKNIVSWMVHMDKNIAAVQGLLGAEKPMFFSVQLFDKWIPDFKTSDNLINSVGWGAKTKANSFLLTGIFSLSYDNGRYKPELVLGSDVSYGGGFYVPSLSVELNKSLRWKTEYDGFWSSKWRNNSNGQCGYPNGASCDSSGLFGIFHNRDQLYTSLTYQF
jgi:hypothetical protein